MALGANPTLVSKHPPSASPASPSCSYSFLIFFQSASLLNIRTLAQPPWPWFCSASGILDVTCVVSHARSSAFPTDADFCEKSVLQLGPKKPKSRTHSHLTGTIPQPPEWEVSRSNSSPLDCETQAWRTDASSGLLCGILFGIHWNRGSTAWCLWTKDNEGA